VKTGVTAIIYENFVYQEAARGCRVRIMKNRFANFLLENLKEMSVLKSEKNKMAVVFTANVVLKFSEEIVAISFISHIVLVQNYNNNRQNTPYLPL
jgi:hypothetical protein